jgi:hypothetical protein
MITPKIKIRHEAENENQQAFATPAKPVLTIKVKQTNKAAAPQ